MYVFFLFLQLFLTAREAELRQLRKSNMEFEERNAALQKHVESMRTAVEKLEVDVIQERSRNTVLQQHLETLRQALTSSFAGVPLPGEKKFHFSIIYIDWQWLLRFSENLILLSKSFLVDNVLLHYIISMPKCFGGP